MQLPEQFLSHKLALDIIMPSRESERDRKDIAR